MVPQNTFDSTFFERNFCENKKILIYGANSLYYERLNSYLEKKSMDTFYFTGDFDQAVGQLLQIKPLFTILSILTNETALIEAIRIIREFSSSTHIIIQLKLNYFKSLRIENLNVSGIISDDAEFSEILEGLKFILDGYRFLGNGIKPPTKFGLSINQTVTNQEQKIMALIGEGITKNQQIAERLYLSPHTVKNHKDNLLKKLNLSNIQDLYFLIRQGAYSMSV